uniref:Mab-21 like 2 n=1 Tax=Hippocampus comes TaxID=109280 RepID=A0A3Q2YQM5_HIPCM
MIATQAKLVYQLNKYHGERCQARKAAIAKTIREVCKVVSDVLKEVEVQEPRFISSLSEIDARYEGMEVTSPNEFEVVLYLNQMGVFNFVDDGSLPAGSCRRVWRRRWTSAATATWSRWWRTPARCGCASASATWCRSRRPSSARASGRAARRSGRRPTSPGRGPTA